MSEDINKVINEYLGELKTRKDNFKKEQQYLFNTTDIIQKNSTLYDGGKIKKGHILNGHISTIIGGVPEDEDGTYLDCAGVVFDEDSMNFHIFPKCAVECEKLADEFSKVREEIINKFENSQYTYGFILCSAKQAKNLENEQKCLLNNCGKGGFTRLDNIRAAVDVNMQNDIPQTVDIYKYVLVRFNEADYTINFMRYTCNKGVVGCTMRKIQFHKTTFGNNREKLNYNANKEFEICYTQNDNDYDEQKNPGGVNTIPKTLENGTQTYTSVCYNPPIVYPGDPNDSDFNNQIADIVNCFIQFIEHGHDTKKWQGYKPTSKKNQELWQNISKAI